MELEVGFGNGVQRFTVPERNLQGVLTPNPVPHALTGEREVRRALSSVFNPPICLHYGIAASLEISVSYMQVSSFIEDTRNLFYSSHSPNSSM